MNHSHSNTIYITGMIGTLLRVLCAFILDKYEEMGSTNKSYDYKGGLCQQLYDDGDGVGVMNFIGPYKDNSLWTRGPENETLPGNSPLSQTGVFGKFDLCEQPLRFLDAVLVYQTYTKYVLLFLFIVTLFSGNNHHYFKMFIKNQLLLNQLFNLLIC